MARLAALATGNSATLATWGIVDATALLDAETAAHVVTTAYTGTRTAGFTPGAITVAGIALKLNVRTGTTGTMDVHLADTATHTEVVGSLVTINTADLPAAVAADNNGGWIYFEFAAPVLLVVATAYEVEVKTSSASQVSLWRDGTAGNVSRLLVTTANPGSLAAADTFDVMKRYTAAGASTAVTVTWNGTATTDFGSGTADSVAFTISGATVTFGAAAATNYYLKLSGNLIVYAGGTLNMGTVATPIPSDSSVVLEFDPAADGDCGLIIRNLGTWVGQGAAKTSWRLLAADVASTATTGTVDSNVTGWKNGDIIAFASTTRTTSQAETKALDADYTGTASIGFAALTNAHDGGNGGPGGVSDAAEVVNLTRNVKVRSATSTIMAYVSCKDTSTVDLDYVEMLYLGDNVTDQRGIEINTTTGSFSAVSCSFHDFEDGGVYISGSSVNNITVQDCGLYSLNSTATNNTVGGIHFVNATSGTTITLDSNVVILVAGTASIGIYLTDVGGTITNNRVSSCVNGFRFAETAGAIGTFSGNVAHSNSGQGITHTNTSYGTCSNTVLWRNNTAGISTSIANQLRPLEWSTLTMFGNVSPQVNLQSGGNGEWIFTSLTMDTEGSYSAATGILIGSSGGVLRFINSSIGGTGTHGTGDITVSGGANFSVELFNTVLGSATEVSNNAAFGHTSYIRSERHDQSATTHKTWYRRGTIVDEETIRNTASGFSWKLTPNTSSEKLIFPGPTTFDGFKVACPAGEARTITAYVYKDATYNGNNPRLVVKGGMVQGIAADVTDTLSVAHSNWEQLSVSVTPSEACVVTFYVDCDGTAGNVYVDDVAIT